MNYAYFNLLTRTKNLKYLVVSEVGLLVHCFIVNFLFLLNLAFGNHVIAQVSLQLIFTLQKC